MPNTFFDFFKGQDQLGQSVNLNYRGSSGFSTIFGGVISLILTLFVATFTGAQLYGWQFQPSYSQTFKQGYLPRQANETYTISTRDFLPTVSVTSVPDASNPDQEKYINNETLFSIAYVQTIGDNVTIIDAVFCYSLIDEWTDMNEAEKTQIVGELTSSFQFCPNVTEIYLRGGILSNTQLALNIIAKPEGSSFKGNHYVVTGEISRFFDAETFNQNGYLSAVRTSQSFDVFDMTRVQRVYKQIAKTSVSYFNFAWLDTSAISLIDFGKSFETYKVEDSESRFVPGAKYAELDIIYSQATVTYIQEWAIESIDIVLGLVGGFSGILWSVLAMLFGGYETFKLENSLIGAVYPTAPSSQGGDDGDEAFEGEQMARESLMKVVAERGKYFYNYTDYMLSSLLRCFTCCCTGQQRKPGGWLALRLQKLERHETASERLAQEIDIVKLLNLQRVGNFIAKLVLKKHQRALVTNFKSYQLIAMNLSQEQSKPGSQVDQQTPYASIQHSLEPDGTVSLMAPFEQDPGLSEEQLALLREVAEVFSAEDSAADLGILYEVTGYQAATESHSFWDNYQDFEALGDTKLINPTRME